MGRVTTDDLITELMVARSGEALLAREVSSILKFTYNREASPKSVSKSLILLDEDYDMLNRRETSNAEKAMYNCRYIYAWAKFNSKDGNIL